MLTFKRMFKDKKGFTLIEMVIVIVLVAVLAAIAVPLYGDYVVSGRASEANNIVGALVTASDAWFTENGTYDGFEDIAAVPEFQNVTARARYFAYTVDVAGSATGITFLATGQVADGIVAADTLQAVVAAAAATVWTQGGNCKIP